MIIPTIGAGLIAASRIMDARHHPFDVITGSLLGVACAWGAYRQYFPPVGETWRKGRAYGIRTWGRQPVPPDTQAQRPGSAGTCGSTPDDAAEQRLRVPQPMPSQHLRTESEQRLTTGFGASLAPPPPQHLGRNPRGDEYESEMEDEYELPRYAQGQAVHPYDPVQEGYGGDTAYHSQSAQLDNAGRV